MKNRVLGWAAVVCGGLLVVIGIANVAAGRIDSAAIAALQALVLGLAGLMLFAGIRAIWMERRAPGRRDRLVRFDSGDREMNAAIEAARQSLGDFLRALDAPQAQQHSFQLKVVFSDDDDDEVEQIWVADLAITDTGFSGVLADEPLLRSYTFKQPVEFESARITDWMYVDDGNLVGGYTTRLIRKRMSPEERAAFDTNVGYSF